jgi:hypothetical protein
MREWLSEIIDQIALGEYLSKSKLNCGSRFGLIAVDNAVEFMLISYVEIYKQLIGGHKVGGIKKKEWDDIKRQFPTLLAFVVKHESKLSLKENDTLRYHDFRNNLYHSGIPITTSPIRVERYSVLARDILSILFSISFTKTEWNDILFQISSVIKSTESEIVVRNQVTFNKIDDIIIFSSSASPIAKEAIALCLYGISIKLGSPPSILSLMQSLSRSGHPLSKTVVNSRLTDLRKIGWLQKDTLILSSKGIKEILKKFIIQ